MWNAFRRDPLAWIIGGLVAVAVAGNVVMLSTRRKPPARVLGKSLVSPSPGSTRPADAIIPQFGGSGEPGPAPTETPEEAAPPPSSAPATKPCSDSTSPDCGRFYWTPSPGPNRGMTIDVQVSSSEPRAGEAVTFVVTVSDLDARIASLTEGFGDPRGAAIVICDPPARYGPWTTPAREAGRLQRTYTHTYAKPGTYVAKFRATSGSVCGSPYASAITIDVPILVRATPSPTPSPSPEGSPSP